MTACLTGMCVAHAVSYSIPKKSSTMNGHILLSVNEGFDRLQRMIVALNVGQEIRASHAAAETGLSEEVCRAVLSGLERAGLMTHHDQDVFERCALDLMNT